MPRFDASAWEPASSRSSQRITSQRMNPRAMSEWIVPPASSAVWPSRSVQARVSFSPAVKNVIRPSASLSRRTTSSSADGAVAERGRLLVGELRQLGLELAVDPVRAVDDRDQRLRRQRIELGRELARPLGQRQCPPRGARAPRAGSPPPCELPASPDLACFSTRSRRFATWSVSATSSSSFERLEVALRIGARREAVRDGEQRVDLPQAAEQGRAGAGHVLHAHRRGCHLLARRRAPRAARAGRRRSSPCRRSTCPSGTRTR